MFKLLIISFAFLLTVACTKQRESQFAQGQGENLLSIASYNGKTFEIKTGKAIEGKKQSFSKAQQLEIKSKEVGEDAFSVVSYEITDSLARTLVGNTAIVGRPNFIYQGLIKVEQNYVKVYKVAKKENLPLSETTYATILPSGDLAVPIIGYPITSRVSIDRSKNEYNEKGSTKIEKNEVDIANATFFRVDMSKGEIFEPVQKTDLLPASFFEGEWYYTETVTAAAEEDSETLGFTGGYDQALTPSTRIKFLSNETTVKVVNLNIDERLTKKADVNYKSALEIPVDWKSFKVTSNGQGMSEQEDGQVHWSKRPYMQLSFDKAKSDMNRGEGRLVALEIKDDYFSFATEDKENGRIRYSFMRTKKRDYTAKRLFKDDKRVFGFFETKKAFVKNYEISRQEDIQKNIFISRFNPRAGKIVFNFTKTTPPWIRPVVQQAVQSWNKAFADAFENTGKKSPEIVLDETVDVELGDLRYNAINVIENLTASNLFGFGPSVTDPFTGEIISATTNVHLTPIREAIIGEVKAYVKMKMGLLKEGRSVGVDSILADIEVEASKVSKDTVNIISDYFPALKGLKAYLPSDKNPNKFSLKTIDFRKRHKGNTEFDIAIASGNIHAEIEAQCSEIVDYVKELQSQKVTYNDRENTVLDSCSRKLVVGKFLGTLVHEMGHNFGLRHNFMGSNDSVNFMSAEKTGTKHPVRSSTVMEYSSFNEDRLVTPGTYDVAAIRFGYADSIALESGSIKGLTVTQSIKQNLSVKNENAHAFKFCTDEDVEYATDPMCQRHDAGETPLEVVKNIIADYQAAVELQNFRGDRINIRSPLELIASRQDRFFLPLLRFYEEWRSGLAKYLGQDDQYLERFSEAELAKKIAEMKADPQHKKFVEKYEPVGRIIFNFFFNLATTENRYCVMQKADGSGIVLDELEKVRQQTFFKKGQSVKTCAEAADAGFWDKTLILQTEVGHSLNTFRYDLSDKAAMEPLDVIGSMGDRLTATRYMTLREAQGYDSSFRGFLPSMLDEPANRAAVQNYMLSRVTQGIRGDYVSRYFAPDNAKLMSLKASMDKEYFPVFGSESELLELLVNSYKNGIDVPSKPEASVARRVAIDAIFVPPSQSAALKQVVDSVQLDNGGYFAVVNPKSAGSLLLIQKYKELTALKNTEAIDIKDPKMAAFVKSVIAGLPTDAEYQSMTIQQMFEKLAPLQAVLEKTVETDSQGALVAKVLAVLGFAQQIEAAKANPDPKVQQQIAGTLAAPFTAFVEKQMGSFPTVETFGQTIQEQNDVAALYQGNRKEFDSQMDLLTSIMKTLIQ